MNQNKQVCVIGGGTGTYVTISALRELSVDISAIVTVADSGGSTGRLRDEFGFLPVGDIRQALAALASKKQQHWIRDLLLYRYAKGSGLEGHNLGNLILTALQDMTGSTARAIEVAAQVFRLKGNIYPVTTQNVQLVIEYQDGTVVVGEHNLDDSELGGKKIKRIRLSPTAKIYSKAKAALMNADVIIIGPGDLYASVLPNLAVKDASVSLANSPGKIVFIMNLMTRYTQTHNMSALDHLNAFYEYSQRMPDYVLINNQPIPSVIKSKYKKEHEYPVEDDIQEASFQVIKSPLIKSQEVKKQAADSLPRSFLRHDALKLRKILKQIIAD